MDQVASHTSDGRQDSQAGSALAIFSPQFSLRKQEGGAPEARVATPSFMDKSRLRRRLPQQSSCAAGEVSNNLLAAGALTAKGRMQFQKGIVRLWTTGHSRLLRRAHGGIATEGRRS